MSSSPWGTRSGAPEAGAEWSTGERDRSPDSAWYREHNPGSAGLGIVLVVLGGLFLARQVTGFDAWHWAWPLFIIASGTAFFIGMFLGGPRVSGLAIPASIITTTGLILLYQNTFHQWQTWEYAWALVFPTAVGFGLWLMGWWGNHPGARQVGRRMTEIGVILFLAFGILFEMVLKPLHSLGRILGDNTAGITVAILLIAVGAYLLLNRDEPAEGPRRW